MMDRLTRPSLELLLKVMIEVRDDVDGCRAPDCGICSNVEARLDAILYDMPLEEYRVFQTTGTITRWLSQQFTAMGLPAGYPVAHPDYPSLESSDDDFRMQGLSNMRAYDSTCEMWEGEYGENRMALLRQLITRAEDQLANLPPIS